MSAAISQTHARTDAQTERWIDESTATLAGLEREHNGLTVALDDIDRRLSDVQQGVEQTDALLDRLEEHDLEELTNAQSLVDKRRRVLQRRQAALWGELLELWKRREAIAAAELALASDVAQLEHRRSHVPRQWEAAQSRRRSLERKLAELRGLRGEVACEVERLEDDMRGVIDGLERVIDGEPLLTVVEPPTAPLRVEPAAVSSPPVAATELELAEPLPVWSKARSMTIGQGLLVGIVLGVAILVVAALAGQWLGLNESRAASMSAGVGVRVLPVVPTVPSLSEGLSAPLGGAQAMQPSRARTTRHRPTRRRAKRSPRTVRRKPVRLASGGDPLAGI